MDVSDRRRQVRLTQEAKIASDFSLIRAIFAFVGFVSALTPGAKYSHPARLLMQAGLVRRAHVHPDFFVEVHMLGHIAEELAAIYHILRRIEYLVGGLFFAHAVHDGLDRGGVVDVVHIHAGDVGAAHEVDEALGGFLVLAGRGDVYKRQSFISFGFSGYGSTRVTPFSISVAR